MRTILILLLRVFVGYDSNQPSPFTILYSVISNIALLIVIINGSNNGNFQRCSNVICIIHKRTIPVSTS